MSRRPPPGPTEPPAHHERVIREFFTAVILHGQIASDAVGMNLIDLFALNIVELHGPLRAGELAERTGLSTGTTTRLVDRLERAGQVRRIADPTDRRRVIIEKTHAHALDERLDAVFQPIGRGIEGLLTRYPTDRLDEILGFITQATTALHNATQEIHEITRKQAKSD